MAWIPLILGSLTSILRPSPRYLQSPASLQSAEILNIFLRLGPAAVLFLLQP